MNDEISFEQYQEYMINYNNAYSRNEHLKIIEDHARYIIDLKEQNREAWFIYDSGWKKLFFNNTDYTIYILLLVLFTGIFTSEYESKTSSGNFCQIMRSTKNGRDKTYKSKYLSASILAIIITVIWNSLEWYFICNSYEMPLLDAPLASIELFENIPINITIAQYIICFYCTKLVSIILLTWFICALSVICGRSMIVITVTVLLTMLPSILSSFGISILKIFDYTSFMQATPLLLQQNSIFIIIGDIFISLLFVFIAKRKWSK